jgi:hypothetical protein
METITITTKNFDTVETTEDRLTFDAVCVVGELITTWERSH